jgi:hypothetical protein
MLVSWKMFTSSKSCSESRIKFLFRLSFALIGQFFLVYSHNRLSEQFSESQAGFGTNFKGTGRNKLFVEGYWKEFHNL